MKPVAIIGAGVSGLTCGVSFAECGWRAAIFSDEKRDQTTSAAAGAIWFPYDCEPKTKVIPWALETYQVLVALSKTPGTGVSMIELRQFSRTDKIDVPDWAIPLGAKSIDRATFAVDVPLTDTTVYLDYLATRFAEAGGALHENVRFERLEDIDQSFDMVINCAGFGAKKLVSDPDLEPHRGQVAIVPKMDSLTGAVVCDDLPLMYAIPRADDCLFGGTNDLSESRNVDPATTSRIIAECSRDLKIEPPRVIGERVGLRPFRRSGVRLEANRLGDGRPVIHNYGHGGSGFTLSWGCANEVLQIAGDIAPGTA